MAGWRVPALGHKTRSGEQIRSRSSQSIWRVRSGIPGPARGRAGWAVPADRSRSAHRRSWTMPTWPPAIAWLAVSAPFGLLAGFSPPTGYPRAINVPLARVTKGQPGSLSTGRHARSAPPGRRNRCASQADSASSILVTSSRSFLAGQRPPARRDPFALLSSC